MKRILCWLGIHNWESCGRFGYCANKHCSRVEWLTGTGYWDLDVCDTRWVNESRVIQK